MTKVPSFYKHDVIKEMRSEIAKKGLILSALVEHYKIEEKELQRIVNEYMIRMESEVRNGTG